MRGNLTKMITVLLLIAVLFAGGCNRQKTNIAEPPPGQDQAILADFNALVQKPTVQPAEVVNFLDANITKVSAATASAMVIGLEKILKEKLPDWQQRFADGQIDRQVLVRVYQSGLSNEFINSVPKPQQELFLAIKNGGYKLETAEGEFFPVIDYEFLQRYRQSVTPDIVAYLDLMAVESRATPIKDAALMISWPEIIERALNQERFLKQYGDSPKAADVRQLLNRYTLFALYGANNTPLFSYNTQTMVPAAKQAYLAVTFNAGDGSFSQVMAGYIPVLVKNDFRLTEEVQQHRKQVSDNLF